MKILLGILVWNEEDIIGQTLKSLFEQTLFHRTGIEIELIVLANGCTDKTTEVSEKAIQKYKNSINCK